MPKLWGTREIAELNHDLTGDARLIFLSEHPAPPVGLEQFRTQVADVVRGEFDLEVANPEDRLRDDARGEADRIAGMIVALFDSGKAVGIV